MKSHPVTRMRRVFPGFLNRSHRARIITSMWINLLTSISPWGRYLP